MKFIRSNFLGLTIDIYVLVKSTSLLQSPNSNHARGIQFLYNLTQDSVPFIVNNSTSK